MYNLNGKKALVTGASGGIGAAIARKLHKNGATVTLSGTRTEPLMKLKEELGHNSLVSECDLSNGDEVGKLIQTVSSQMGGLDILINNAGLTMDNLLMRMQDYQLMVVVLFIRTQKLLPFFLLNKVVICLYKDRVQIQ